MIGVQHDGDLPILVAVQHELFEALEVAERGYKESDCRNCRRQIAVLLIRRGDAYMQQSRWAEAEADYTRALEIIPDADNSGGPMKGEGLVHSANGQQFTMHVSEPGGYETPYGNGTWWLRHQAPPEMHWVDALAEANIGLEPPDATTGTENVVVSYEFSLPLFDDLSLDGEGASVRHILTAGETIGFTYQLNEADAEARDVQLSTAAENGAAWDATFASDYTLLAIGEYDAATAVEGSSWAKIKASFDK